MGHESECWSPTDELLDRFVAEQAAPDERVAVEAWLARTPGGQRTVHALRRLRFDASLTDAEHRELWQLVERRIGGVVPLRSTGRWHRAEAVRKWNGWYAVAGLALSAMLLLAGWGIGSRGMLNQMRRHPSIYSTARGERANITLPDGSTVVLNVGSRLDVPADYIAGNRTVRLTGEALFEVAHSGGKPFTVLVGTTAARVLGTTFLARHYALDPQTTVAVKDGKVTVGSAVLTAGRRIEVGDHGEWRIGAADPAQFSFVTGTLTLPEMSLAQAIPMLDRWYDADVLVNDSALAQRHIVGEFRAGSLADLRAILVMTFHVSVVRDGRTLTLFPR